MKLEEAINITKVFNTWRRGDIEEIVYSPKEIGIALDVIINDYEKKHVKGSTCTKCGTDSVGEDCPICDNL